MQHKQLIIAGVDEVGRGCLFGPVFAGAVILFEQHEQKLFIAGLKDSKVLSPKKRAELVPLIKANSVTWALGQSSAKEIDEIGIQLATEKAMLRALQKISKAIDLVLVDGLMPIREWAGEQKALVKGETKSLAIAAASVLAKEERDNLIKRLANNFPDYGLESHVGYGTKIHRESILRSGSTYMHRESFLTKLQLKNQK